MLRVLVNVLLGLCCDRAVAVHGHYIDIENVSFVGCPQAPAALEIHSIRRFSRRAVDNTLMYIHETDVARKKLL